MRTYLLAYLALSLVLVTLAQDALLQDESLEVTTDEVEQPADGTHHPVALIQRADSSLCGIVRCAILALPARGRSKCPSRPQSWDYRDTRLERMGRWSGMGSRGPAIDSIPLAASSDQLAAIPAVMAVTLITLADVSRSLRRSGITK